MAVALRGCLLAFVAISTSCTNSGCLRNSECDKGLECRDDVCQRPLAPDAGAGGDAQSAPLEDAATTLQSPDRSEAPQASF
jgi:hypothetical protein